MILDNLLETGLVPEWLIRLGIRYLLGLKLKTETLPTLEAQQARLSEFIAELKQMPIAIETDSANEQHYEVPEAFYRYCLGPRYKYSSAYWDHTTSSLAEAEERMLRIYCERAGIEDGQVILDLGCGWGSVSLWLAEQYPNARITGLSNSASQKVFIDSVAREKGFTHLEIVTANIVTHDWDRQFDRIISIEMMEHMKNYARLFEKISRWLTPEGQLFIHIFTHKTLAYHYEESGPSDWLTRYFFRGGTMPSHDLFLNFQQDLRLIEQWAVDGTHYQKTAEAWLANMKRHKQQLLPILAQIYGPPNVTRWWVYWQVFFLACAELWGYGRGQQWLVSHYLFKRQR